MKLSRAQQRALIRPRIILLISMCFLVWSISFAVGKYQDSQRIEREDGLIEAQKKPDIRTRVEHPLNGPYQAIVHLTLDKGEKVGYCSGFVIAPKAVLTNSHCLEDVKSVLVEIGERDEDWLTIYKSTKSARFLVSASGLDYGVIFLSDPIAISHFSLQEFPENADSAAMVTAGYPGDKDYFTMWENEYHGFVFLGQSEVISGGVSAAGQSGSPLFQIEGERFVAKGIHYASTCGGVDTCPLETTFFVPFTDQVLKEIRMWIAMSQ